MSAPAAPSALPTPPGGSRRPPRWLWLLLPVGLVIIVGLFYLVSTQVPESDSSGATSNENLDPANPGDSGTMALARIINDRGVQVNQVRGLRSLESRQRPDADTTIVMTKTRALELDTAQRFWEIASDAARVIIIEPDGEALGQLGLPVTSADLTPAPVHTLTAGCTLPGVVEAGDTVDIPITRYQPKLTNPDVGAIECFTNEGTSALIGLPSGAGGTGHPETVVVAGDLAMNSTLAQYDHAGVMIRAIAPTDTVLWYMPQFGDEVNPPQPQLPRALWPLMILALILAVAVTLWRGRRFGPLISEPLPAVVKAIETTEARGRLYFRANADDRAAATLRGYTQTRLARYLGLPFDAERDAPQYDGSGRQLPLSPALTALIDAVAAASGNDPTYVGSLLAGPLPVGEDALVHFSTALKTLDKEVRRL